ncbi:MAG: glycosyltransferase family 2 protein [Chloroflexi bacterium]|nr:glycosyltransferase family 2 protein [Chloroflexota bacterium]
MSATRKTATPPPGDKPVLLIIPAHNEANNLGKVLAEVKAQQLPLDVLVVDDCSKDETAAVAEQAGARVLRLPFNLGYGGAVQAGFRYAVHYGYDFCVMMDADGQHAASSIAELLQPVRDGKADVALGSRFRGRMDYHTSFVKRVGMAFFSQVVSRIARQHITDPTSGFQAMNRDVISFFASDNYPVDFPDADTILLLHFAGFCLQEVPVVMRERLSGESMHSSWKPIYYVAKMFLSIFIVLLREKTHKNALRPRKSPPREVDTQHA